MYEQGYADFWNFCDPQEDNSEYMIGWQDAEAEDDEADYHNGWCDARDGREMATYRNEPYYEGYNSYESND